MATTAKTYSAPGVYVEEQPSGVMPITGVGTSTAAFIGIVGDVSMPPNPLTPGKSYSAAPSMKPVLIDSWEQFKNRFGDVQKDNLVLANAVYGYFANGGRLCYVVALDKGGEGGRPSGQPRSGVAGETAEGVDQKAQSKNVSDALELLDTIDDVSLVVVPGAVSDAVQKAVLAYCADDKRQNRFAILDGRPDTDIDVKKICGGVFNSLDGDYGAIYYPWLKAAWVETSGPPGEEQRELKAGLVPPSGHVAGLYARVDAARGVHKAPANESLRGVIGVDTPMSRERMGLLNTGGVNVIREFDSNVMVWGARTIAGKQKPDWKYISSRRLFIYLRESIRQSLNWAVFEPNGPDLWAKIRRNVNAFLTVQWSAGALFGNTPQEAFYVQCDESTNTKDVRKAGQVVTNIGVSLTEPAEFVVFRISQWAGPGE